MRSNRWKLNEIGVVWTILFIIGVELLWVFDPLSFGNGVYWIDILNYLMRSLLIAPMIWCIAAWNSLRKKTLHKKTLHWSRSLLGAGIIVCSLLSILVIVFFPHELIRLVVFYTLTLFLVLVEILVEGLMDTQRIPWVGIMKFIASIIIVAALFWPTPYQVIYPGITMNMGRYAIVQDKPVQGQIMSVLIFDRPAVPMDWLYHKLFPYYSLTPRIEPIGSIPEQLAAVWETKLDANQVASAVAFEEAGLGQDGIYGEGNWPYKVTFQPYVVHEGGPSHGAMLTLALIDKLTPGGVTHGHVVAGTGTISMDGTIGRIGGITQKAYTVSRKNVDVFFVPASQYEEARKGSAELNIVPVNHIRDILDWLKNN
jgi:hypothetical protein